MKKIISYLLLSCFAVGIFAQKAPELTPISFPELQWEEVDIIWGEAFNSVNQLEINLQDLEHNLLNAEFLIADLTTDLNQLNFQWDKLVVRMQENDESYYQMYVDYNIIYDENEELRDKLTTRTWWIVGGTVIGLVAGVVTGFIIGL